VDLVVVEVVHLVEQTQVEQETHLLLVLHKEIQEELQLPHQILVELVVVAVVELMLLELMVHVMEVHKVDQVEME
tara:strand:+ start:182 stop:406 length:225 start_codon:yes stop_codon:yes gene_type:complete